MSRREWPLLFAIFLDLVGFGMAFPDIQLRAERLAREADISQPGIMVGVLLSSYFLVQLLASPQWGRLSDRIGRKPVLLICTGLSVLSMLVYAFANSLWIILLARVVAGFAAANVVVAQAYVADSTSEEQRDAAMGRVSTAIMIGLIAGPAIGGELVHQGGNYLMGLCAAGMSFLSLLWIYFAVPMERPKEQREPGKKRYVFDVSLLRDMPAIARIFSIAAAGWFALACLEGTFGRLIFHNLGLHEREFGWIFSYESLIMAAIGVSIVWIGKRVTSLAILRIAYFGQAIGLALTPLAPSLFFLFLTSTVYAIGIGLANPVINSICSKLTPESRQGELFGLIQASRSIGFLIGPLLAGKMFDIHPGLPYFVAGGVALLGALLVSLPESARSIRMSVET